MRRGEAWHLCRCSTNVIAPCEGGGSGQRDVAQNSAEPKQCRGKGGRHHERQRTGTILQLAVRSFFDHGGKPHGGRSLGSRFPGGAGRTVRWLLQSNYSSQFPCVRIVRN